jgi:hypothetical protein
MTGVIAACAAPAFVLNGIAPRYVLAAAEPQPSWRFCNKCNALFYDGYRAKGRCSAGGSHVAAGHNFEITYDSPNSGQQDWRFCNKCNRMFYDGYQNKGVCPAGGSHIAQGYNFALPHDRRAGGLEQKDWRFCNKCQALFFDGYPNNKGRCPAGGGHVAQGYNFVLNIFGNLEHDQVLIPIEE